MVHDIDGCVPPVAVKMAYTTDLTSRDALQRGHEITDCAVVVIAVQEIHRAFPDEVLWKPAKKARDLAVTRENLPERIFALERWSASIGRGHLANIGASGSKLDDKSSRVVRFAPITR